MLLARGHRYVSDPDLQDAHRRAEARRHGQPARYDYRDRPEPVPPAAPIDHARRAAYRAYGQNRSYAADFIGPRFSFRSTSTAQQSHG